MDHVTEYQDGSSLRVYALTNEQLAGDRREIVTGSELSPDDAGARVAELADALANTAHIPFHEAVQRVLSDPQHQALALLVEVGARLDVRTYHEAGAQERVGRAIDNIIDAMRHASSQQRREVAAVSLDDPGQELFDLAKAKQAANPHMTIYAALDAVGKERPELVRQHNTLCASRRS